MRSPLLLQEFKGCSPYPSRFQNTIATRIWGDSILIAVKIRPTFLIAEPEPAHALSTRKLVMETAKFNVLTAHSSAETLETLERFPSVDAVVVHSELADARTTEIFAKVKQVDPGKPTILLMSGVQRSRKGADHILPSDDPESLLALLRELFGDPRRGKH